MVKKKVKKSKVIARVRQSKKSKQKTITIPKSAKIKVGEWVVVRRARF